MTTVVGMRNGERIYMAADCLASNTDIRIGAVNKFVEISDPDDPLNTTYIGVSGPMSLLNALRMIAETLDLDFSSPLKIYESFCVIHQELKDKHFFVPETDTGEASERLGGTFLVANRTGLYQVLSEREVFPVLDFAAIGSGREFAMGAMSSFLLYTTMPGADMVRNAIRVASQWDKATGMPEQTLVEIKIR